VQAAAALCNARLSGDSVGSTAFAVEPQAPVTAGDYHFSIGTAGAAPLVVQTVLMPLALSPGRSRVTVTGGTHVPHAPAAEYLEAIYIPVLRRTGLHVSLSYSEAGFYPRGGGKIIFEVDNPQFAQAPIPSPLILNDRGKLESLHGYMVTSNLPPHVAERGGATVEAAMRAVGRKVTIEHRDKISPGTGAAVVLAARCQNGFAGFTGIGELRKPMEKVAEAPCKEFMPWWKSGAACDEHLADQLVLPLAFASGESRWTTPVVTDHLRTVIWLVRQFLPIDVSLTENSDGSGEVRLHGVGTNQ
jgi:RNA 3'-terminal phosphate cyclase (ATP)